MSNHYIGLDLFDLENNGLRQPISRITLYRGDNAALTAGDDTGLEVVADCIYVTQEMVEALLSAARGYQYHAYSAQAARLNPAAELGDTVEVGDIVSVLAQISDNGDLYPDIAAPGDREVEDEYPAAGPLTKAFDKKLAEARSEITKTIDKIVLAIYGEDEKGGLNGRVNTFTMGLSGISNEIKGYKDTVTGYEEQLALYEQNLEGFSTDLSKYKEDVNGYTKQVSSFEGSVEGFEQRVALYQEQAGKTQEAYSLIDQKVNNITLQVTNNDATASIQLVVNGENQGAPAKIEMNGLVTFASLGANGTTSIDGSRITTGSINASRLNLYGEMEVRKSRTGDVGGVIGYCKGWESTNGIGVMNSKSTGQVICTDEAVRISHGNNSQVICMDDYLELRGVTAVRFGLPAGYLEGEDDSMPEDYDYYARLDKETFRPYEDRAIALGNASNQWTMLWAESCTCCPSDINKKNSVEILPDKYVQMFDLITPKRFKMNNGTSGRYHVGYIAQEVKAAMDSVGLRSTDFAGWIMDTDAEGNAVYFLRYEEFGAIYAAKIKQLEARIAELEASA